MELRASPVCVNELQGLRDDAAADTAIRALVDTLAGAQRAVVPDTHARTHNMEFQIEGPTHLRC